MFHLDSNTIVFYIEHTVNDEIRKSLQTLGVPSRIFLTVLISVSPFVLEFLSQYEKSCSFLF